MIDDLLESREYYALRKAFFFFFICNEILEKDAIANKKSKIVVIIVRCPIAVHTKPARHVRYFDFEWAIIQKVMMELGKGFIPQRQ